MMSPACTIAREPTRTFAWLAGETVEAQLETRNVSGSSALAFAYPNLVQAINGGIAGPDPHQ